MTFVDLSHGPEVGLCSSVADRLAASCVPAASDFMSEYAKEGYWVGDVAEEW